MPRENTKKPNLVAVPKSVSLDESSEISMQHECAICQDTGLEYVEGKGARVCSCRKQRSREDQFLNVRLPRRYDGFHFHNYKPQTPSQDAAFKLAASLAMEFPAVDRGLLLMGSVGVGKTHLAVAILKGLTERGFNCLFYEFGSLLKEIQDSYNPNTFTSELSVLAPVLNSDVLVLDELGASKPTDWVRDTMAHIINTRYNDKKLTIFTTNYFDERKYDRDETLDDRIGSRLRSRLFEMCKTVMIDGRDYRRKFDQTSSTNAVKTS